MRKQWLIFLPLAFQARGNGGLTWFNNSERRRHATEDNDVSDTFKGKRVKRAITNKPFSILWTRSEKVISSINAAEQARSLVLDCFSAQALQSYRNIIGLIAEVLFSKAFSSSTMKTVNTRGSERKGDEAARKDLPHRPQHCLLLIKSGSDSSSGNSKRRSFSKVSKVWLFKIQ